jgi:hypothetical protein
MAEIQIRIRCPRTFRLCKSRCWGCIEAELIEVVPIRALGRLSGGPGKESAAPARRTVADVLMEGGVT